MACSATSSSPPALSVTRLFLFCGWLGATVASLGLKFTDELVKLLNGTFKPRLVVAADAAVGELNHANHALRLRKFQGFKQLGRGIYHSKSLKVEAERYPPICSRQ